MSYSRLLDLRAEKSRVLRHVKPPRCGEASYWYVCKYVCMGFMALIAATVLCARSQDSLLSVSVLRIHVVFSTAGFKGGGKPCPKTRETTALRRGVQKASLT